MDIIQWCPQCIAITDIVSHASEGCVYAAIVPHACVLVEISSGQKDQEPIWWVGGGTDLTPSYVFEDDCVHFHQVQKDALDRIDESLYPRFKKWCDEYFYLKHRQECRGIGRFSINSPG